MKGILWKWTNYWNGWQPRWFVLENGVLAYYTSQEEANQGSKGSMKISVCDIVSHPNDNTRLDLIIHGEQHFYLKAATAKERQMWIVALGTAKAAQTNQKRKKAEPEPDIRSKKSELRLYCDLLMQQVHSVKDIVTTSNPPNTEELSNATSLLQATCDTFIKTLENCMQLSEAANQYSFPVVNLHDESDLPAVPSQFKPNARCLQTLNKHSLPTVDKYKVKTEKYNNQNALQKPTLNYHSDTCSKNKMILKIDFGPVIIGDDFSIDTASFLDSCRTIIVMFDVLGSNVFSPVRSDIVGNIYKLNSKYLVDPISYKTLQLMISAEINEKTTQKSGSATDALLWLKRTLQFMVELIKELIQTEDELNACVSRAYYASLSRHHGILVRGVFSMALRAVPYRKDFIDALVAEELDTDVEDEVVKREAQKLVDQLQNIIQIISIFYQKNNLEFD